jgi:hypothetical protein
MKYFQRAILSLFLVIAFFPGATAGADITGDINADGKIDLKEAIHALQVVAGMRGFATDDVVVFAWNDLGMHCLNPTYDSAVILPPYNTVWAQVIQKGAGPNIITNGISLNYSLLNNTYSYGKRDYGQFWDNMQALFGTTLDHDKGLNLAAPDIHNGLAGQMIAKADHFQVDGIPVTPVNNSLAWNPYQVAEITVKDISGAMVARTKATVPTSDDINCAKCHGVDAFQNVLEKHDQKNNTNLQGQVPVLCASCHGSPVLGTANTGSTKYLSEAIHGSHANRGAACYDCHPGQVEPCNRSIAHTDADGRCITCHGTMAQVAGSITDGSRVPWLKEPKCVDCHTGIAEVDTGATLYRNAKGHGNLYCAVCHGSPHAMVPTTQDSDNYQAIQYQNVAKTLGSCGVCHEGSRGEQSEIQDFSEKHGGPNPQVRTACNVCHTSVSATTSKWPHAYQWKNR